VIDVRQLTRRFDGTLALDDVSFQVHPGEIVALLGPNGAGKTTASRIIGGILAPSQGDVLVDGISVRNDANQVRARCGFVYGWRITSRAELRGDASPAHPVAAGPGRRLRDSPVPNYLGRVFAVT